MLKTLKTNNNNEPEYATDSPKKICECCSKQGPSHKMINIIIVIGSPGHETLKPFQCSNEEHWACSIECWAKVGHACIDEHMIELLKNAHNTINRQGGVA